MSFAFKRGVRAKKSQLGAKNVSKKLEYWKKIQEEIEWAKLKNVYPWMKILILGPNFLGRPGHRGIYSSILPNFLLDFFSVFLFF